MPLLKTPNRSRATSAVLVLATLALPACNDAGSQGPLAAMSATQLFGATYLTSTERRDYIKTIHWRLSALMKVAPPPKPVSDALLEELSECVIDNLQDRTTRLQFSMAIDTIKTGGFDKKPDFSAYRALARSKGMDNADFDQQAKETVSHIKVTGRNCLSRYMSSLVNRG